MVKGFVDTAPGKGGKECCFSDCISKVKPAVMNGILERSIIISHACECFFRRKNFMELLMRNDIK